MKVALTGASGTGKTTLAKHITESFPDLPFIEVGPRSVAEEMGLENPYHVDGIGKRTEFQCRLLDAKREVESRTPRFVTDRTSIDQLAYWHIHSFVNFKKWKFDRDNQDAMDEYIARAIAHARTYDLIFWCPVGQFNNYADDPIRVQDKYYHQMHEAIILGLMDAHALKAVPITTPDLQKRKDVVVRLIGRLEK